MVRQQNTPSHLGRVVLLLLVCAIGWTGNACAQLQDLYPGFFSPANPQVLDAVLFGGGFGS